MKNVTINEHGVMKMFVTFKLEYISMNHLFVHCINGLYQWIPRYILKPISCIKCSIHNISLHASATTIYSASIVESAIHFCNLNCHDTTPHANVIKYPAVDFMLSKSSVISKSVYLTSTAFHPQIWASNWKYL